MRIDRRGRDFTLVADDWKHETDCTKSQILCIKICSYLNMAENVMKITFLKPSQNILGSI